MVSVMTDSATAVRGRKAMAARTERGNFTRRYDSEVFRVFQSRKKPKNGMKMSHQNMTLALPGANVMI